MTSIGIAWRDKKVFVLVLLSIANRNRRYSAIVHIPHPLIVWWLSWMTSFSSDVLGVRFTFYVLRFTFH
jgi:hypothetical protein